MDTKETTSNVESTREKFEEPITTYGSVIRVERIWRDSNLIPTKAPTIDSSSLSEDANGVKSTHAKRFNDGATIKNLLDYYEDLELTRVHGTTNCYSSKYLSDIITEDSFGETYVPRIYVNGNQLAYGLGKPVFDVAAGTLYFNDKEFAEDTIYGNTVTVTFYRYVGRKGTSVGNDLENLDLPFRDNIKHFKNAENDSNTATFKVRGDNKDTNYILPPENGKYYDKGDEADTGVVLLQENLEDVLWTQNTRISGGEWVELNGSKVVYRHNAPNVETGEDASKNTRS